MKLLFRNAAIENVTDQSIYINGCGGVGAEIAECFANSKLYKLSGFIDDNPQIRECMGFSSRTLKEILVEQKPEMIKVIISMGEPVIRQKIAEKLKAHGIEVVTLDISSHCNFTFSKIGNGCLLHESSYISLNTSIGKCCVINKEALVGHDSVIGDYSVISPKVVVGGFSTIGSGTFIGAGTVIRNSTQIGNNVIVGMGSVVVNDIENDVVVAGNPARVIHKNTTGRVFRRE